jgi:hypothetical protein
MGSRTSAKRPNPIVAPKAVSERPDARPIESQGEEEQDQTEHEGRYGVVEVPPRRDIVDAAPDGCPLLDLGVLQADDVSSHPGARAQHDVPGEHDHVPIYRSIDHSPSVEHDEPPRHRAVDHGVAAEEDRGLGRFALGHHETSGQDDLVVWIRPVVLSNGCGREGHEAEAEERRD